MLVALDNNLNVGREQKKTITRKGQTKIKIKNHFFIAYRKPSEKFVARKMYNKKSYQYLERGAARLINIITKRELCHNEVTDCLKFQIKKKGLPYTSAF